MARSRPSRIGWRPALVLAAIALVVASLGVAVIGSRPQDPSIGLGPTPSAPSATPLDTMPAPFSTSFALILAGGNPFTMTVTDDTGVLVGAESGQPAGDGASVERVTIDADPADPRALLVTWTGTPCETRAVMTVNRDDRTILIESERCSGDALPYDRVVRLRFGTEVTAADWSARNGYGSEPTDPPIDAGPGQPSPSAPPDAIHVELIVQGGNPTSIDVVDQSGLLVGAVSGRVDEITSEFISATNDDDRTVRLTWPGSPCDTVHRLTIAADLGLTIDRPECGGDAIAVYKSLVLTFSRPVDAAAMDTALLDGRAGSGLPAWTTTAPDANGARFDVALFDPGALVASLSGYFDPQLDSQMPGPGQSVLEEVDPSTIRLIWNGPSCATAFVLSILPDGNVWTLSSAPCASTTGVLRMVDIALRGPRPVGTIRLEETVITP